VTAGRTPSQNTPVGPTQFMPPDNTVLSCLAGGVNWSYDAASTDRQQVAVYSTPPPVIPRLQYESSSGHVQGRVLIVARSLHHTNEQLTTAALQAGNCVHTAPTSAVSICCVVMSLFVGQMNFHAECALSNLRCRHRLHFVIVTGVFFYKGVRLTPAFKFRTSLMLSSQRDFWAYKFVNFWG